MKFGQNPYTIIEKDGGVNVWKQEKKVNVKKSFKKCRKTAESESKRIGRYSTTLWEIVKGSFLIIW